MENSYTKFRNISNINEEKIITDETIEIMSKNQKHLFYKKYLSWYCHSYPII